MTRLFVAVWPPEEVLDCIAALDRPAVKGLRWTEREQWHVTLRFLGPVEEVEPVVEALGNLDLSTTEAELGPAVDCFGGRILHVPVAGLEKLAGAVVRATSHLSKPPDDRPFHGHVTLARTAKRANVDLRGLTGATVQARWKARELVLVESRVEGSSRYYDSFAKFSLNDP